MATIYPAATDHAPSYYAASANPRAVAPALEGVNHTEICVIGGGYSGLSAALHLAEAGHKVALIEGKRIGWGASGRNGGQIVNGLNASLQKIKRVYGDDTANFVGSLVMEGGDIIRQRIEKYGIECDHKPNNIFAAFTDAHMRDLEATHDLWQRHGVDSRAMLDAEAIREHVGTDAYRGGMIDRKGGHIHPLNLALGEAQAFESLGGLIYEQSPVSAVEPIGEQVEIRTDTGVMRAKTAVICGNAYLGHVVPTLTWRVMPVSTQMMATQPLAPEVAAAVLPSDACVEDVRYILNYYRLSADKRLIFGGGTVYSGKDPADIEAFLRKDMARLFPSVAHAKVDYVWSGHFALSFSRVPQLGRINNNIYFAHGYSGHGVTGSHLFGRILAEAINGDRSRFDVFARIPWIPFPGGRMFRVPYSMIGAWYYGMRDRLGI